MTGLVGAALPTLALMFALGLRHGLDPDHVAVIDTIVFRMVDERPRRSSWTSTLFAIGHSLAVGAVAIGVAMLAGQVPLPRWLGSVIDAMVVPLLLLVGTLNLATLLRPGDYAPVCRRGRLLPASLRTSTRTAAVLATGIVFGLVFDTVTQAMASGAAASTRGGIAGAAAIALAFAVGMTLSDTPDSRIVSRPLGSSRHSNGIVQRYRRAVAGSSSHNPTAWRSSPFWRRAVTASASMMATSPCSASQPRFWSRSC